MALRVFQTIRRWRALDEVIETSLGTLVAVAWLGGSAASCLLSMFALLSVGARGDWMLFAMGIATLVLLLPMPFFTRIEEWIRKKALQPGINRGKLAIGSDGVRLTGLFLERFAPFAAVESIEVDHSTHRVVVRMRGRAFRVRVENAPAVAAELNEGLRRYRERAPSTPIRAFAEARANLDKWLDRAKNLVSGGYREEVVTPDVLVRVAEDPSAPPEQRIGAALALANAPEPLRVRVRVAAEDAARPHVGEALAAAIDGEVDLDLLKRATAD